MLRKDSLEFTEKTKGYIEKLDSFLIPVITEMKDEGYSEEEILFLINSRSFIQNANIDSEIRSRQ